MTCALVLGAATLALDRSAGRAGAIGDPVVYAAGDIACDPANQSFNGGNGGGGSAGSVCQQRATSDLIASRGDATAVLALGDNQYDCGSLAAYQQSYDLATGWGRFRSITYPVPGNHEYLNAPSSPSLPTTGCDATNTNAAGYFAYFGAAAHSATQGYYYVDPPNIPGWRLIALNANCRAMTGNTTDGCKLGSAQETWLRTKALANPPACILAFFHQPLFNNGMVPPVTTLKPLWDDLYNARADLVINGHEHAYERYLPQTSSGVADPAHGVTEIVAGTGGANHTDGAVSAPNIVVNDHTTFGVLRLVLHPTSWESNFIPAPGGTLAGDPASGTCHDVSVVRPGVATQLASGVATNAATLNGQVNPMGVRTTYEFEYGTTTGYGAVTTPQAIAGGTAGVAVSAAIGGLQPGTTYHYRLDATNGGGTTLGNDATFTTLPGPPGGGGATQPQSADRTAPTVVIHVPGHPHRVSSWGRIHGTVSDAAPSSGIAQVQVSLIRFHRGRCLIYASTRHAFVRLRCPSARNAWVRATLGRHGTWSLVVHGLVPGGYTLRARGLDRAGNLGHVTPKSALTLHLRGTRPRR